MIIHQDQFFALFGNPGAQPGGCYLTDVERRVLVALARHVRPKVAIEFGVQDGQTARAIWDGAPSIRTYVGIDLPEGERPALVSQAKEVPPEPGAAVANRKGFKLLRADSRTLHPVDLPRADLVFVDGGHDADTVRHDTALAFAQCRPGGVIVWHDYNPLPEIGVRDAIDALNREHGDRQTLVGGTWLVFRFVAEGENLP